MIKGIITPITPLKKINKSSKIVDKKSFTNIFEVVKKKNYSELEEIKASLRVHLKKSECKSNKLMLEKFNTKFDNLSSEQKKVLKEYIVNITDTTKLKSFVDTSFTALKESLLKVLPKIEDATAKIKVNEAINLITPVLEYKKLKDEHIVSLLQ